MAGVVVGHGQIEPPQRQLGPGQDLDDVPDAPGEGGELGKPMSVLLHRRAAARGVGDDEIEIAGERGSKSAGPG